MKWRIVASHCLVGVLAILTPSIATTDHFNDAISYTVDTIEGGEKGDTAALVTHEKAALESAKTVYASTVGSLSATDLARFGDATHDVC